MTEHPAIMLKRLLQEKHDLILENEKLRSALIQISQIPEQFGIGTWIDIAERALGTELVKDTTGIQDEVRSYFEQE